jgi:hypothetical protein
MYDTIAHKLVETFTSLSMCEAMLSTSSAFSTVMYFTASSAGDAKSWLYQWLPQDCGFQQGHHGTTTGPHGDIEDAAGTLPPPDNQPGCSMVIGSPNATQLLVKCGPLLILGWEF